MPRSRSIVLPLLLATALVGSLAPASLAQDDVTTSAGVNADRVDGLDAVKATGKAKQRANKLVATNKQGLLPSNILRPIWSLLQGIPAVLADGQVSWGELLGIPAGFADGTDDIGVSGITLTRVVGTAVNVGPNSEAAAVAGCPAGSKVTGGGATTPNRNVYITTSFPSEAATWQVWATNIDTIPHELAAYAICMSTIPASAIVSAKKGVLPASVKRAMRKRGR